MALRIILPLYRYTIDLSKEKLLFEFPNSIFGTVISSTDSDVVEIQEPSVTPAVMNVVSALVMDYPIPKLLENMTHVSRYLGIPLLDADLNRIRTYQEAKSPLHVPMIGLYNSLLGRELPELYLSMIDITKMSRADYNFWDLILDLAMKSDVTSVIRHFMPILNAEWLLPGIITHNQVDLLTEVIQDPKYQKLLQNPRGNLNQAISTAVVDHKNAVLRVIIPYLNQSGVRELFYIAVAENNRELVDLTRPHIGEPDRLQSVLNIITDIESGLQQGYIRNLRPTMNLFPKEIDLYLTFAPNEEVKDQARELLNQYNVALRGIVGSE